MQDAGARRLPPTQALVLEVLAARWQLGETSWTCAGTCRPALEALHRRGLAGWKPGTAPRTVIGWLTERGRDTVLAEDRQPPVTAYQDLLAAIGLYINWRFVTSQLTTAQKDLFADAVDADGRRTAQAEGPAWGKPATAARWWRDI